MIRKIVNEIITELKAVNEDVYCEVEYDGAFMDFIDVRIMDDGFVPVSEMILNRFLQNQLIHNNWNADEYTVDIPSKDEIKFGFSGHKFERIAIDLPTDLCDASLSILESVEVNYEPVMTGLGDA